MMNSVRDEGDDVKKLLKPVGMEPSNGFLYKDFKLLADREQK
jgi:hypothetical protein